MMETQRWRTLIGESAATRLRAAAPYIGAAEEHFKDHHKLKVVWIAVTANWWSDLVYTILQGVYRDR